MKALNTVEMQNINAGGYKCSACGKKFYKRYIGKIWFIKMYTNPKDDCLLHIMCANRSTHRKAKAKWCW